MARFHSLSWGECGALFHSYYTQVHSNESNRFVCKLSLGLGFFVLWHINLRGLFNAQVILVEEQYWSYLTPDNWNLYPFLRDINSKVNIILWLKFELTAISQSSVLTTAPWESFPVCELFLFDRNTWNHITMGKLFIFDWNSWYYTAVSKKS